MTTQYHILNGDCLKEQFPKSINGEIIVARECLVDGSVVGPSLSDLFKTRAKFISENYDGVTEQDYMEKTVPEFMKMQNIHEDAEINLWFEEDLFCQVNFWFSLNVLIQSKKENPIYLIKPKVHNQLGFGGLDNSGLLSIYENRILLTELETLADLWIFYQSNDLAQLLKTALALESKYPFILTAVNAHIERVPQNGKLGRPSQTLIKIMKELGTEDFDVVFKEFSNRENIYGFGDLQVQRLIHELKINR